MQTIGSFPRRAGWLAMAGGMLAAACTPSSPPPPSPARAVAETVTVRSPEAEQRASRAELRLFERDAQIEDLEGRLDAARQEVVRAMAKLQTLASRAEAASGMAESEIALDSLKSAARQQGAPEIAEATRLLRMSTTEFNKGNYGGALYLSNEAKSLAAAGQERLANGEVGALRPGEVLFALPLHLQTTARGNVREGPGTSFKVAFTLDAATPLVAYSYADVWVRVGTDGGRSGWINATLVGKRQDSGR